MLIHWNAPCTFTAVNLHQVCRERKPFSVMLSSKGTQAFPCEVLLCRNLKESLQ